MLDATRVTAIHPWHVAHGAEFKDVGQWKRRWYYPQPGEDMTDAVRRRGSDELGIQVTEIRLALPDYRYRAVDASGIVENEICPVYLGRFTGSPAPDPTEVGEWELLDWAAFRRRQETEGDAWSPWCREQARLIEEAGLVPSA